MKPIMAQNTEIKFFHDDVDGLRHSLGQFGFANETTLTQEDVYLLSQDSYFKLRINNGTPAKLLKYSRLTSPVIRASHFEAFELDSPSSRETAKYIFQNAIKAGVVSKRRRQFSGPSVLLNFDTIFTQDWQRKLYSVVEVEYFGEPSRAAQELVGAICESFSVKSYQLLPYSNIHMVNMLEKSAACRDLYHKADRKGRLALVDGGSGTGKSTIKDLLVQEWNFKYARRDTTRAVRPDDLKTQDYNFVGFPEFRHKALFGEYIEFRDFLFGMSYGLPWSEFIRPLFEGESVMALINLGNGYFTKRLFPEATLILLYSDLETIRTRLESRGTMKPEQITERLDNNRLALTYKEAYDVAIDTSLYSPLDVATEVIKGMGIRGPPSMKK
jgi:guanylate kinase